MDTFISNSAYNVINLYDICALGPKYPQKRRKIFFRAYATTNLIVWPYLWRGPRYATESRAVIIFRFQSPIEHEITPLCLTLFVEVT